MPAYLVRCVDAPGKTDDFIGVFVATSLARLYDQVDELLDPNRCEYLQLRSGDSFFFQGYAENPEDNFVAGRSLHFGEASEHRAKQWAEIPYPD